MLGRDLSKAIVRRKAQYVDGKPPPGNMEEWTVMCSYFSEKYKSIIEIQQVRSDCTPRAPLPPPLFEREASSSALRLMSEPRGASTPHAAHHFWPVAHKHFSLRRRP